MTTKTIKNIVSGKGQVFCVLNNEWVGTAIEGTPLSVTLNTGDTWGFDAQPAVGYKFIKGCDSITPVTCVYTSTPYWVNVQPEQFGDSIVYFEEDKSTPAININLDVKSLYGYGTGRVPEDKHVIVKGDVFTLFGQAEPNSSIWILKSHDYSSDYESMGTVATNASGNFSFDYSSNYSGLYAFIAVPYIQSEYMYNSAIKSNIIFVLITSREVIRKCINGVCSLSPKMTPTETHECDIEGQQCGSSPSRTVTIEQLQLDKTRIQSILDSGMYPYYLIVNGYLELLWNSSPNAYTIALMTSSAWISVFGTGTGTSGKAVPSIVSSTGYVIDSSTIALMCLYENKASRGYKPGVVKSRGSRQDGTSCWPDADPNDIALFCAKTTAYNLKGLAMPTVRGQGNFNMGCIESFGCAGGDVCGSYPLFQDTCSTWGERVSFETSIPIRTRNTSYPLAPTGLKITPGSGLLAIEWNMVNDPTGGEVFAYHIVVYDGSTVVIAGYTEAGLRTVNIGGLTNGKVHTVHVTAISHNGTESLSSAIGEGTPGGIPEPRFFSICWATNPPCGVSPTLPPVTAGTKFKIMVDIYNVGSVGKAKTVFTIDGVVIGTLENPSLTTCTGEACLNMAWIPTVEYTMPNRDVSLTVETFGWDGTNWVQAGGTINEHDIFHGVSSATVTISTKTPACSSATLTPYTASIEAGEKVTFTAAITPATTPFAVQFKDRAGAVLGACTTGTEGTCTFIWDSAGKPAGTYYVKAVSPGCASNEATVVLSPPISQFNVTIVVIDSAGNAINGAAVTVGTQTKVTDVYGVASFIVDRGSIEVSISKTGYTPMPPVTELVFNNTSFAYSLSAATATTGSIQFVSINTGAQVSVDNVVKGTIPSTGSLTVSNLSVGTHAYKVTLAGYNSSTGSVTVTGGVTAVVSFVLTVLSPTTGSLYIYSSPPAAIFLGGVAITAHTPTTIPAIAPGVYAIKLTAAGYQDWTGSTTIEAGKTKNISVTLEVLTTTGTLEIDSVPQGARVYIDGVDRHKITKASIPSITTGEHTYRLELSGYRTVTDKKFTITAGKTTIVSETLTEAPIGADKTTAAASPPASTAAAVVVVTLVGLTALAILLEKKKGTER